jgi:RNA polymerase sigma-70 factor (ECF subfamily)
MRDDPDQELVARSLEGDAAAFSQLVSRHQDKVYALANRFMRDPTLAEDMAQEAFLKAFRLLKSFKGRSKFSTWLYKVTCNVCLTELSRRRKRGELLQSEPSEPSTAKRPDETASEDDLAELIRAAVNELPPRYAGAVRLYYFEEKSYEEVAAALDIPVGTLKTWLHRARKQLRALVEKEIEGSGQSLFA